MDELWDAFNTLTLLVPGHLSPRKVLPDSIRIPEEVMAVMLKRKNTASSCRNTQSAAITASLPGTGTRSYRWLQLDSSVSPLDHLRAPLPLSHGMVLRKCTVEMWDPNSHFLKGGPGGNQCKLRTEGSVCGTGSREFMAFCSEF